MNKPVNSILLVIYLLFALIWALLYGMIAGFIFKVIATWEDFIVISNKEIRQWKRFSKRSYEQYINEIISTKKLEFYEIPLVRETLKKKKAHQPFPIYSIFINVVVAIIVMPFRGLSGIFKGPIIVFKDLKRYWDIRILKINPLKYYENILKNLS